MSLVCVSRSVYSSRLVPSGGGSSAEWVAAAAGPAPRIGTPDPLPQHHQPPSALPSRSNAAPLRDSPSGGERTRERKRKKEDRELGKAMKTEISTAAGFITRLLRTPGGIGDEELRCFSESLQEALRGEAAVAAAAGEREAPTNSSSPPPLGGGRARSDPRAPQPPLPCRMWGKGHDFAPCLKRKTPPLPTGQALSLPRPQ